MMNNTIDNKPLRVDIVGADNRTREIFERMFDRLGHCCIIVNATVAEAAIIDLDQSSNQDLWPKYQQLYPKRPTLCLSTKIQQTNPGYLFVQKPIKANQLLAAITQLRRQIDTDNAQPEIDDAPTIIASLGIDERTQILPMDTLQAILGVSKPVDHSTALQLSIQDKLLRLIQWLVTKHNVATHAIWIKLPNSELILDPTNKRIAWQMEEARLRELCQQAIVMDAVTTQALDHKTTASIFTDSKHFSIENTTAFLWRLAIWTYGTHLPVGTDIDKPVYLARWPNLTRMLALPDAMRIAALWTMQPMTLTFTAETLHIPVNNVYTFYSAAYSIGLAGPAKREADRLFLPLAQVSHDNRPLWEQLITHLQQNSHTQSP